MQCYNHPEQAAVAACGSCGKGVCETCAVEVGGRVHCKECLAAGTPGVVSSGPGGVVSRDTRPTNTVAAFSLVAGLIGLLLGLIPCVGLIGLILGIAAAAMGWMGRNQIVQSGGTEKGEGFATAGLALGILAIVLAVLQILVVVLIFGCSACDILRQYPPF